MSEPVRGRVRAVAPNVAAQGVVYPDEGAASVVLLFEVDGRIVEHEMSLGEFSQAVAGMLRCAAETRSALRTRYGAGLGALATPEHLAARS